MVLLAVIRRPDKVSMVYWGYLQLTDPYLNIFRGFVPPLMGTMDFSELTPLLFHPHPTTRLSPSPALPINSPP